MNIKPICKVRANDLEVHELWEFATDVEGIEGQDETSVLPVNTKQIPLNQNSIFVTADYIGPDGRKFIGIVDVSTIQGVQVSPGAIVTDSAYAPLPDPKHWMADSVVRFSELKLGISRELIYPLSYRLRRVVEGEVERRCGVFTF